MVTIYYEGNNNDILWSFDGKRIKFYNIST